MGLVYRTSLRRQILVKTISFNYYKYYLEGVANKMGQNIRLSINQASFVVTGAVLFLRRMQFLISKTISKTHLADTLPTSQYIGPTLHFSPFRFMI